MLRLLSTRRGLLSLAGFLLIWIGVLNYAILPASRLYADASSAGLTDLVFPELGLQGWQQWPAPELAVYWAASLYMLPFLAVFTAADQTASDRSRGTLRFFVLRCSRLEIFLGRYLGQLIVLCLVVLFTLATVIAIIAWQSPELLPSSIASSPVIIVNLCLLLLPYIALMALVSIMAKSARQATLFAVIIWFTVSLLSSYLKVRMPELAVVDWMLPGAQVSQLLHMHDWKTLALAPIPLVHTLVLLVTGAVIMQRRDL